MDESENSGMYSTPCGKCFIEKDIISKSTSNIQQNSVLLQINYYANTKTHNNPKSS